MEEMIQIPDGLNQKERDLYRALMRSKLENIERRWNYSNAKDIVGHKKTNSMNGEVKITFSYPLRESFKNEKGSLSMAAKELEKMKRSFDQRVEEAEKRARRSEGEIRYG